MALCCLIDGAVGTTNHVSTVPLMGQRKHLQFCNHRRMSASSRQICMSPFSPFLLLPTSYPPFSLLLVPLFLILLVFLRFLHRFPIPLCSPLPFIFLSTFLFLLLSSVLFLEEGTGARKQKSESRCVRFLSYRIPLHVISFLNTSSFHPPHSPTSPRAPRFLLPHR